MDEFGRSTSGVIMAYRTTYTTASPAETRRLVAALAANLPPPEDVKPRPAGRLCRHAVDTGEPAFIGIPCRGNRIECKKMGVVSFAARCRNDLECKFYEEETEK